MAPRQSRISHNTVMRVLMLVVSCLCLGLVMLFGSQALKVWRARTWTPADATIIASGYSTSSRQESFGPDAGRKVTTSTLDRVVFAYTVAGQSYEADTPSFFQRFTLGKNSPRFPVGQAVVAYYDPSAPGTAVLTLRPDSGFWVCLGGTFYMLWLWHATLQLHRRAHKALNQLGGVFLVGVGLLVIIGALVANTDRPVAHFVALGAFAGLPVYLGAVSYLSRWVQVPGLVSALAMVVAFITLIASFVSVG